MGTFKIKSSGDRSIGIYGHRAGGAVPGAGPRPPGKNRIGIGRGRKAYLRTGIKHGTGKVLDYGTFPRPLFIYKQVIDRGRHFF